MKTTKIIKAEISNSNENNVRVEERYDEMAISLGIFVVVEHRGRIIEEAEAPFESTANYLFESFVKRY